MKIMILPGLDGTGLLAPELQEALEEEHIVVPVAYPPQLYRYEDILAWLGPQLPVDDYILVAESFSGPVAALVGAEKPPGLRGIVFVATFARRPSKLPVRLSHILKFMPLRSSLSAKLAQPFLMGKWSSRAFTHRFRHALRTVPVSTLSKRLAEVLAVDVVDALARIDTPSLYLRATNDRLIPAKLGRDFADIKDIEGPHFLLQARADEAAKQIADFAKATERPPAD